MRLRCTVYITSRSVAWEADEFLLYQRFDRNQPLKVGLALLNSCKPEVRALTSLKCLSIKRRALYPWGYGYFLSADTLNIYRITIIRKRCAELLQLQRPQKLLYLNNFFLFLTNQCGTDSCMNLQCWCSWR